MTEQSMPGPVLDELRAFHRFLSEKLSSQDVLSPEEALDEWRRLHPDDQALEDDVAAIRQALDDMANGDRGTLFDQFDRDFRNRHNLPGTP
jgi:hypothetical protein